MHSNTTKTLNISQFGLGYQATPTILVGASYAISTMDSSLINAQVRYSLSKRSTIYGQVGYANNGSRSSKEFGAFAPVATTSGNAPAGDISGYELKGTGNVNSTAVGVGIIHTF
jgi:predicted porin